MNFLAKVAEKKMGDLPTSTSSVAQTRPEKMRALAWFGKEDVKMIDTPIPTITDPTDAIIKVTGTTVCGSDLHLYHGEILQLEKGDILGHEFMGIVEEVGSNVNSIKIGQRVVAAFSIACGTCEYCKKQLYTACSSTNKSSLMKKMYGHKTSGIFGYSHFLGGFAGGQSEYVRVPFADVNLFVVEDDQVPDEKVLYLSDIVCTSYHAVVECNPQPNDVVGIWGLGPIGLLVAQWLRVKGVKRIIGIDNVPERMQLASSKFGVETVNFDEVKVNDWILDHISGGLDRAIDCAAFRYSKSTGHRVQRAIGLETDTPEIVNEAIHCVKKFGTIAIIADYVGSTNGFMIGPLMEKGIRLIGCGQAPVQKYIKECFDYIQRGEFDPGLIVTHRFDLESVPELYKRFDKKESGIMKVFVQTKFSSPPSPGFPPLTPLDKDTVLQAQKA